MALRIGDIAPDFVAETTRGRVQFHRWIGDGWAILFSHPKDFTPVCTTELAWMATLEPLFAARGCKVIGLSADPMESHQRWLTDVEGIHQRAVEYPLVADHDLTVAKLYDMLPADAAPGARTPMDNATIRSVIVVGPDKRVKATLSYPMSTGRNFDEILRLLDSLQLTAKHAVATPVNWRPGEAVVIPPAVSDEDAAKKYPQGWKTLTPYLRLVSQPE